MSESSGDLVPISNVQLITTGPNDTEAAWSLQEDGVYLIDKARMTIGAGSVEKFWNEFNLLGAVGEPKEDAGGCSAKNNYVNPGCRGNEDGRVTSVYLNDEHMYLVDFGYSYIAQDHGFKLQIQ